MNKKELKAAYEEAWIAFIKAGAVYIVAEDADSDRARTTYIETMNAYDKAFDAYLTACDEAQITEGGHDV